MTTVFYCQHLTFIFKQSNCGSNILKTAKKQITIKKFMNQKIVIRCPDTMNEFSSQSFYVSQSSYNWHVFIKNLRALRCSRHEKLLVYVFFLIPSIFEIKKCSRWKKLIIFQQKLDLFWYWTLEKKTSKINDIIKSTVIKNKFDQKYWDITLRESIRICNIFEILQNWK